VPGRKLVATSHFTWRNDNLSVYKAFDHQHLNEIGQSLKQLQADLIKAINFIPYRGDFTRGIIASIYTESDLTKRKRCSFTRTIMRRTRLHM
jgi:N-acetyl-gamma-glutamyl-phosphate reductase